MSRVHNLEAQFEMADRQRRELLVAFKDLSARYRELREEMERREQQWLSRIDTLRRERDRLREALTGVLPLAEAAVGHLVTTSDDHAAVMVARAALSAPKEGHDG